MLTLWNGAMLFQPFLEIGSFTAQERRSPRNLPFSIVERNSIRRKRGGGVGGWFPGADGVWIPPSSLLIIAEYSWGSPVCLDLTRGNNIDCPVVHWDHETTEITEEWAGIAEWLDAEMTKGRKLYSYDGTELEC